MPRIVKALPSARADYSFGDLLYWHLFVYGTRPTGDPAAAAGREWEAGAFCDLLGINDRTLRNWIADKHFPDSTAPIAHELFGDNPKFDAWRLELTDALRAGRQRKVRKSPDKATPEPAGAVEDAENVFEADDTGADAAGDQRSEGQRPRLGDLVPYASRRGREERTRSGVRTVHLVWSSRPSSGRRPSSSWRPAGLFVSGLVIALGAYAWTRPSPKLPVSESPATAPLPPEAKRDEPPPKPDARKAELPPAPEPRPAPPPAAKPDETPLRPEPRKAEAPKPEPPKVEPLPVDPQQAGRAAEEAQREREAIAARQRAFDDAQRARDEEARRLDQDADDAAAVQRERDQAAREIAGLGYRLMENTSVGSGGGLAPILTADVAACARACQRDHCDAFTFSGAPHSGPANYCYRYSNPVSFHAEPSFRSGQRVADAPPPAPRVTGELASAAPIVIAQAPPTAAAPEKPDDVTRCANGPVKVTGFTISCDRILGGGTTLGSAQLSYTVANINQCAAKCRPIARCVGFTYNAADPDGQHGCMIFGPTPESRDAGGWISGTR